MCFSSPTRQRLESLCLLWRLYFHPLIQMSGLGGSGPQGAPDIPIPGTTLTPNLLVPRPVEMCNPSNELQSLLQVVASGKHPNHHWVVLIYNSIAECKMASDSSHTVEVNQVSMHDYPCQFQSQSEDPASSCWIIVGAPERSLLRLAGKNCQFFFSFFSLLRLKRSFGKMFMGHRPRGW